MIDWKSSRPFLTWWKTWRSTTARHRTRNQRNRRSTNARWFPSPVANLASRLFVFLDWADSTSVPSLWWRMRQGAKASTLASLAHGRHESDEALSVCVCYVENVSKARIDYAVRKFLGRRRRRGSSCAFCPAWKDRKRPLISIRQTGRFESDDRRTDQPQTSHRSIAGNQWHIQRFDLQIDRRGRIAPCSRLAPVHCSRSNALRQEFRRRFMLFF